MANDVYNGASLAGSGWSQAGNWQSGVVPNVGDNVEISGGSPAMDTFNTTSDANDNGAAVEQIGNLLLDANMILTIDGTDTQGPATLDVTGTFNVGSGGQVQVSAGNSLYYEGTSASGSVSNSGNFYLNGSGSGQTIYNGGTLQVDGHNNNITLQADGTTTLGGFGNTEDVNFTSGSLHLIDQNGDINTMNLMANTGLTFDIQDPNGLATTSGYQETGNSYQFNFTDGSFETVNFTPIGGQSLSIVDDGDNNDWIVTVVCFAGGTRIRTTRGEVAVEDLAIGDLAVTASGEARPIVWLGHKRIARPGREHWPVRVLAGAFGEHQPRRDLFLSPGHAVCVDVLGEVFVPIDQLLNGATIAQVEVPAVTYWHVELESHDVLLAEGLPAESYMDAGNRAFFGREYGHLAAVDPQRVAESLTRYARPFVDGGALVAAIRQRLAARAEALGRAIAA